MKWKRSRLVAPLLALLATADSVATVRPVDTVSVAPSPAPTPAFVNRYAPRVAVYQQIIATEGVARAVNLSVRALWRLDGDVWSAVAFSPAAIVVPDREHGGSARIEDLVGAALPAGHYAAALLANGEPECARFEMDPPMRCGNSLDRLAPPLPLPSGCDGRGYLAETAPADGTGGAVHFLEDGRVARLTTLRHGMTNGLELQYLASFNGLPLNAARWFVDNEIRLSRTFDSGGRLVNQLPYENGRPHGRYTAYAPSGRLIEETIWNHRRVVRIRAFAENGATEAEFDGGPEGAANGTICRPNHQCSQW